MKLSHLAPSALLGIALTLGLTAAPAHAGVDVDIAGGGNAYVKITAKTSAGTVKVGKKYSGRVDLKYHFKILGFAVPTTAYYASSFPKTFKKPSVREANVRLKRPEYRSLWNPILHKKQWQVRGKQGFAGDLSARIVADTKGKGAGTGYFCGGTYPCDGQELACTNAHALVRAIVKK